jgi:GT2 family glycosyltransferase
VRLAALLTCHNRRETTLASLRRLCEQQLPERVDLSVFLVDDGSTDGTSAAVCKEFPQVRVLAGDGSLFWAGGMRRAFDEALKEDFDYYFWLNDDSLLNPDALACMITTERNLSARGAARSIIAGSLCDPDTGSLTYGGVVRTSRIHPIKYRVLAPSSQPLRCDTLNGNAVLISRSVARTVGNIREGFTHTLGDFDYGLRAGKLGCSVWIVPGFVGTCRRNKIESTWRDSQLTLRERLLKMQSVKGLPPREYRSFVHAHGGILWPLFWLSPYFRVVLQSLLPADKSRLSS